MTQLGFDELMCITTFLDLDTFLNLFKCNKLLYSYCKDNFINLIKPIGKKITFHLIKTKQFWIVNEILKSITSGDQFVDIFIITPTLIELLIRNGNYRLLKQIMIKYQNETWAIHTTSGYICKDSKCMFNENHCSTGYNVHGYQYFIDKFHFDLIYFSKKYSNHNKNRQQFEKYVLKYTKMDFINSKKISKFIISEVLMKYIIEYNEVSLLSFILDNLSKIKHAQLQRCIYWNDYWNDFDDFIFDLMRRIATKEQCDEMLKILIKFKKLDFLYFVDFEWKNMLSDYAMGLTRLPDNSNLDEDYFLECIWNEFLEDGNFHSFDSYPSSEKNEIIDSFRLGYNVNFPEFEEESEDSESESEDDSENDSDNYASPA
jgi:hypothetical protein